MILLTFYIDLKKKSSNKLQKSAMLRYCLALPLWNEPKHSYVGLAVTEIIYFLSRKVKFWDIAAWSQPSWLRRSTEHSTCPMKSRVLLKSAVQAYPFPLHITWQIGCSNNTEQHTSKKKTIHWTISPPYPPTPYPSSALWLQASASK